MATLESRLTSLAQHVATQMKNIKVKLGDLTTLTTTEKNTLVGALNEINGLLVSIDDTQTLSNKTRSSTKIQSTINTAIANLINGAGTDSDTLKELADAIAALVQADNGLVSASASQSFDSTQKATARNNIGAASQTDLDALATNVGNTDHDYVADFNTIYNA